LKRPIELELSMARANRILEDINSDAGIVFEHHHALLDAYFGPSKRILENIRILRTELKTICSIGGV
jgi:hypothetical protein